MCCRLTAIAQHGVLSVLPLSCPQLAILMPRLLPSAWQHSTLAVPWRPDKEGQPTRDWLRRLWHKLQVWFRSEG